MVSCFWHFHAASLLSAMLTHGNVHIFFHFFVMVWPGFLWLLMTVIKIIICIYIYTYTLTYHFFYGFLGGSWWVYHAQFHNLHTYTWFTMVSVAFVLGFVLFWWQTFRILECWPERWSIALRLIQGSKVVFGAHTKHIQKSIFRNGATSPRNKSHPKTLPPHGVQKKTNRLETHTKRAPGWRRTCFPNDVTTGWARELKSPSKH